MEERERSALRGLPPPLFSVPAWMVGSSSAAQRLWSFPLLMCVCWRREEGGRGGWEIYSVRTCYNRKNMAVAFSGFCLCSKMKVSLKS